MTAVATRPEKAASKPPKPRTRKPLFQEPLVPDRPIDHKGIPIVEEEAIPSPLGNGTFFKITKLHLADGTIGYACVDCLHTADTRGQIMAHRNAEHGAQFGKKRPKVVFEPDEEVVDAVLPPRADDAPAPSNIMEWTLAEFLALAPTLGALGDLITKAEDDKAAAENELNERAANDRLNATKLAAYDGIQSELVERRMVMKNLGTYEEIKAEVLELRAWKKAVTKKFESLGFTLTEEEK